MFEELMIVQSSNINANIDEIMKICTKEEKGNKLFLLFPFYLKVPKSWC